MTVNLKDFEQNLDLVATKNMFQWDFEQFKTTHPTFYKTILEAVKLTLEKE